MTDADALAADWIGANHRLLNAEFARLRATIGGVMPATATSELEAVRSQLSSAPAIDKLAEAFELSTFERDVLLLCAARELECCGQADGEATIAPALFEPTSFASCLRNLQDPHWSSLAPTAPLRRRRLITLDERKPLTTGPLRIEERVLLYLVGLNYLDPKVACFMRQRLGPEVLADPHLNAVESAAATLNPAASKAIVRISGDDVGSHGEAARRLALRFGLELYELDSSALPTNPAEMQDLLELWGRESILLDGALLIHACDVDAEAVGAFLARCEGLTLVSSQGDLSAIDFDGHLSVARLSAAQRRVIWNKCLGDAAGQLNGSLEAVCAQFELGTADIIKAARWLRATDGSADSLAEGLWSSCRKVSRNELSQLAQRIEPKADWTNLILPDAQLCLLHEICNQVHHRFQVHERWGYAQSSSRGLGISALFSGESGTGKTMAAEVLARNLNLDLYRIDLSSVVNKYIGETEKNLKRVFDAAESSGAILLFDEADALFGKRTEVKDSHDRFANVEISYLLQRMEEYRGLVILTTNLKAALDSAFSRRLRFIVHFPFPDEHLRERIWRGAFPSQMPLGFLDYGRLAQLSVAGGEIRNIALNAAFMAADDEQPLSMAHLLNATRRAASKRERPLSEAEVRGWA
jgi:hypothetical protein